MPISGQSKKRGENVDKGPTRLCKGETGSPRSRGNLRQRLTAQRERGGGGVLASVLERWNRPNSESEIGYSKMVESNQERKQFERGTLDWRNPSSLGREGGPPLAQLTEPAGWPRFHKGRLPEEKRTAPAREGKKRGGKRGKKHSHLACFVLRDKRQKGKGIGWEEKLHQTKHKKRTNAPIPCVRQERGLEKRLGQPLMQLTLQPGSEENSLKKSSSR